MATEEQLENKLGEDACVTMLDVLADEQELEHEYNAVLGASDEKACTYAQGSVKRQALYSCLTCCPEARDNLTKSAGICLACSYRCHENHELIELYTKRNFRCDCPTERLPNGVCKLNGSLVKSYAANATNEYNQNFQGLYCTCQRPYPDPERKNEEEMLQCAICEDWYHLSHLELSSDASKLEDIYCEMICSSCMQRLDFLNDYREFTLQLNVEIDEKEPEAKKIKIDETDAQNQETCKRPKISDNNKTGTTFWGTDWRAVLCKCTTCLNLYKSLKVEFLLDPEDFAKSYEDRGLLRAQSESSTFEQGIKALASIGHVQQINAITEFNHMKDKLKDYLRDFACSNKVVTEQDITTFFEQMRSESRERISTNLQ